VLEKRMKKHLEDLEDSGELLSFVVMVEPALERDSAVVRSVLKGREDLVTEVLAILSRSPSLHLIVRRSLMAGLVVQVVSVVQAARITLVNAASQRRPYSRQPP
jgi:hypothetical protein